MLTINNNNTHQLDIQEVIKNIMLGEVNLVGSSPHDRVVFNVLKEILVQSPATQATIAAANVELKSRADKAAADKEASDKIAADLLEKKKAEEAKAAAEKLAEQKKSEQLSIDQEIAKAQQTLTALQAKKNLSADSAPVAK